MLRKELICGWLVALAVVGPLLVTTIGTLAYAATPEDLPLAIEGYSPVSYFEEGHPEPGRPEFTAVYNGRRYHLRDAEQLAKFEAEPRRYEPLFTEHCPYSLTLGRAVAIDPERFKIVDGHLLLFHRSEELDGLEAWNAADDDQGLLKEARRQYTLFRF